MDNNNINLKQLQMNDGITQRKEVLEKAINILNAKNYSSSVLMNEESKSQIDFWELVKEVDDYLLKGKLPSTITIQNGQ